MYALTFYLPFFWYAFADICDVQGPIGMGGGEQGSKIISEYLKEERPSDSPPPLDQRSLETTKSI